MSLTLLAVAVFFVVWDFAWWAVGVRPVLPGSLKTALSSSPEKRPILVDVRTAFEYRLFRIEGTLHHPGLLRNPSSLAADYIDRPIVVICMSGHRSAVAAYLLKRRGFKNVSYLVWGMLSWVATSGPTTRGQRVQ